MLLSGNKAENCNMAHDHFEYIVSPNL